LRNGSTVSFPPVEQALDDPNGLLAVGGDLSPEWLLEAYRRGIFPWFNEDDGPILWWSPDPRGVLELDGLRVSRSLRKRIRNAGFEASFDRDFAGVVAGCSEARSYADGTWITPRMAGAYRTLHELGYAHSLEIRQQGELVGGLYGVSLGAMFFGESMFSRVPDASKVALYHLVEQLKRWDFDLIDCQMINPHLATLGVIEMPRAEFLQRLAASAQRPTRRGIWSFDD